MFKVAALTAICMAPRLPRFLPNGISVNPCKTQNSYCIRRNKVRRLSIIVVKTTARSYSTVETPSNRLSLSVRRTHSMRTAELMNSTKDQMTKVLSQKHLHLARSMAEPMPLLEWNETTRFSLMTSRSRLPLIWLAVEGDTKDMP